MLISAGTRLGPYEIVSALGAGGMGEVYRARDTRLDRTVAIKVLLAQRVASLQIRERFEREARAISSLSHAHICALYDIGNQDGVDYLVMEYLEGETLAHRLKRGPLPPDEVLRYAIQMADALDTAHRHGVTHRDLKPGNVMLTKSGAKLLDFGLAKVRAAEAVAGATGLPTATASLTAEGTILGTLQYMAPEQLEGKEADARTDIFALGAVIYEMVTGRNAFEGKSQASLISAIMTADPLPISVSQSQTPPALDRVVRTCLAKDPDGRWQSAHDISVELKWIAEGAGVSTNAHADAAGLRRVRRTAIAVGLPLVLLVGTIAAVVEYIHRGQPLRQARSAIPLRKLTITSGEIETGLSERLPDPAISPDGRYIAVVRERGSPPARGLSVYELEKGHWLDIPETEDAFNPFWSADSDFIGFFAEGSLKKVSIHGGSSLILCSQCTYPVGRGTWSANGDEIVFTGGTGLSSIPSSGGKARPLITLNGDLDPLLLRPTSGADAAVVFARYGHSRGELQLLKSGSPPRFLLSAVDVIAFRAPVYSPSGHLIYERQLTDRLTDLWAVPFSLDTLATTGEPFPIVHNAISPSVSGDGTLVYRSLPTAPQWRLVWFDRTGKRAGDIGEPQADMNLPSISPDGRFVAVEGFELQTGIDVWIHDTRIPRKMRLTRSPERESRPVWSPDGKQILFWRPSGTPSQTWIQNVDGEGVAEPVPALSGVVDGWSPGRFPLFGSRDGIGYLQQGGDGKWETKFLSPRLAEGGAAKYSPDGRYVVYVSSVSGRSEIWVRTVAEGGKTWQISIDGGIQPRWVGKEIFFVNGKSLFSVPISTTSGFAFGAPTRLFSNANLVWPFVHPTYDVSPDGRRFVLIDPVGPISQSDIWVVQNWFAEFQNRQSR
jgi:Tol biopolymer transport system component